MSANLQLDPRVQAIVQAMYTLDRPVIPTRPSDRLTADVALAMEAKHKGLLLRGNGRVGKTFGARMLAQTYQWRPYPLTVFEMSYGNPSASTEAATGALRPARSGATCPACGSAALASPWHVPPRESRHWR